MTVERLNPDGVVPGEGFVQVAVARGTRTVFFSGQVGRLPDGAPAGPDLRSQTAQAMRNLETLAQAVGVTRDDIAKTTIYIKDYNAGSFDQFIAGFGDYLGGGGSVGSLPAATTFLGVQTLFDPWALVEIEATAVTD
jgi:enamine deaminase RidA (YjgF/YER057c/UK114 family)